MINKENVQLWIDALRSGEFLQAEGTLHGNGGYCCMGVACEVYKKATGYGEWDLNVFSVSPIATTLDTTLSSGSQLPGVIANWFGFTRTNPIIATRENATAKEIDENLWIPLEGISAMAANDSLKWDFLKIADCLENMYIKQDLDSTP